MLSNPARDDMTFNRYRPDNNERRNNDRNVAAQKWIQKYIGGNEPHARMADTIGTKR